MDDFLRRLNDVIMYQTDPDDSGTILEMFLHLVMIINTEWPFISNVSYSFCIHSYFYSFIHKSS